MKHNKRKLICSLIAVMITLISITMIGMTKLQSSASASFEDIHDKTSSYTVMSEVGEIIVAKASPDPDCGYSVAEQENNTKVMLIVLLFVIIYVIGLSFYQSKAEEKDN